MRLVRSRGARGHVARRHLASEEILLNRPKLPLGEAFHWRLRCFVGPNIRDGARYQRANKEHTP